MEHQILKKHTTSGKNGYMYLALCCPPETITSLFLFKEIIDFWLRFIAAHRLYLAAASRGYSLVVVLRVLIAVASLTEHGL